MAERELTDDPGALRERVRERYAAAATAGTGCGPADSREATGCCGGPETGSCFGPAVYGEEEREAAGAALETSLGCGVPTAVADLHDGETVLDLGSGAGGDALISARRVGPRGKVYGVDMTDEMLALARRNADEAGLRNVEFLKGVIEELPLPGASVDVVISNCVINLSADKRAVLREAARVLRPGGRLAVTDIIADDDMDDATRADMEQWTGCVAGALTRAEFESALEDAGFEAIELHETHRVHAQAGSAIVRARKPPGSPLPAVPSFCSLEGEKLQERVREVRELFAVAEVENRPGGVRLRMQPGDGTADAVRDLIARERECCPTLSFDLSETDDELTLDVTDQS